MRKIIFSLICILSINVWGQEEMPFDPIDLSYIPLSEYQAPPKNNLKSLMDIALVQQCNQTWSGDFLGTCSSTICDKGCALCCVTMVLNTNNVVASPQDLNNFLKLNNNQGYADGCNIFWAKPCDYAAATMTCYGKMDYDLNTIKSELDAGNPIVAPVKSTSGGHFVLIVGYTGTGTLESDFYVNDPGRSDGHNRGWDNYEINGLLVIYHSVGYQYNYTISGNVVEQTNFSGLSGVTVTINTGGTNKTITTSSTGYYTFEVANNWSGTVSLSKAGYTFAPTSKTYSAVTSNQKDQNYSAYTPPGTDFTGSPTSLKVGNSVTFTDLSTNGPTSWSWTFQGGTPTSSTSQNPTISYNTAGKYNVTLTTSNLAGSSAKTKSVYITVTPKTPPKCSISGPTQVTKNQSVTFTDASTNNPSSWDWTFIGGDPSVSHTNSQSVIYSTAGNYSVTLQTTNADGSSNCTQTIEVVESQIIISGKVQIGTNPLSGATITFTPGKSVLTRTDGTYSYSVPYNWSGSIRATKIGYYFPDAVITDPINSNKTANFSGWSVGNYKINFTPSNPITGQLIVFNLEPKLPIGFTCKYYIWVSNTSQGLYFNGDAVGSFSYTFYCTSLQSRSIWVSCEIFDKNNNTYNTPQYILNMAKCPEFKSSASYTNGCSTIKLGQLAYMTDDSYPFNDIKTLGINWDFGHLSEERYHSANCVAYNGSTQVACSGTLLPSSRIFSHLYTKKGSYSVRWQAGNGYFIADETWRGFNVVDCNSIVSSNNLSDCTYSGYGGIDNYWAGTINIAGSAGNFVADPNKQLVFTGCNAVKLLPGFSAKPNAGKYFIAKANDPCLNIGGQKSIREPLIENFINSDITPDVQYSSLDEDFSLNVYPNPSSGLFSVFIPNIPLNEIEILNSLGQVVKVVKVVKVIESNRKLELRIDSKGMYLLKFKAYNKTITRKIIIN